MELLHVSGLMSWANAWSRWGAPSLRCWRQRGRSLSRAGCGGFRWRRWRRPAGRRGRQFTIYFGRAPGGLERMRDLMMARDAEAMLDGFIEVFSNFWAKNRLLLKRIHGIAAIDPEFGKAIQARNQRRHMAAARVVERLDSGAKVRSAGDNSELIGSLVALTSFEFFDVLAESLGTVEAAEKNLPGLIRKALLRD